jgi:DNA-binding transcriptional LysR family regulator
MNSNISHNLDQLIVLDAIDREGGFSKAAKVLHRATSAVSYSVRNLEEQLGISIFDRSGHRACLTPEGQVILDEARAVLNRARELETVVDQLRKGWEPKLDIVLDGSLPMTPIMRALSRFNEDDIPTRIRLKVEYLNGVKTRFNRDNSDLMLVLDWIGDTQHITRPLPPVEMCLVVKNDHRLAQISEPIERSHLTKFVELVVTDSSEKEVTHHRLSLGGADVFELSDFHSKRQALLEGVGFGWMPLHLASDDLAKGTLLELNFVEGSRYRFSPYLVRRINATLGRSARLFIEYLDEAFELDND